LFFAVAAAEATVGLALVISIYRRRNTVLADDINLLKW
jgi:NADH:ubiquinone oxidoreductase subunit K